MPGPSTPQRWGCGQPQAPRGWVGDPGGVVDGELPPGDLVAGVRPGLIGGQDGADGEPGLAGGGGEGRGGTVVADPASTGGTSKRPEATSHALLLQVPRTTGGRGRGSRGGWRCGRHRRGRGEWDRLDHLLELGQAREGPVGEQQPVGDEVAVVQGLAEVAAVGEELAAVSRAGTQAVVDPLHTNPPWQRGWRSNSSWYSHRPPGPLSPMRPYSQRMNGITRRRRPARGRPAGPSRRPMASTSAWVGDMRL